MRALVSGQSAVALLNEGEQWYLVRAPHAVVSLTRFSSAIRLLDGSTDVAEIQNADPELLEFDLAVAHAKDTALQYVLVLLEESDIGELERRMLARLKELLFFPDVTEITFNRLYSAPLIPSSLNQAKALIADNPRHPLSELLGNVVEHQEAIARVRSAWDNVSTGRFPSIRKKDEFFLSAVERGLVRKLARNPGTVLREANQTAGENREIIQAWAKTAGARGESVDRVAHGPGRLTSMSDGELVEALTGGMNSDEPWAEFLRRFHRLIARVAYRTAHRWGEVTPAVLEELVQDVYVRLCDPSRGILAAFEATNAEFFSAYLRVITANLVNDYIKSEHTEKRAPGLAPKEDDEEPTAEDLRTPSASTVEGELWRREIDELLLSSDNGPRAERNRQIFWLYYSEGMTAREIAALRHLNLTIKGVESVLMRTMRMVRERLMDKPPVDKRGLRKFLEHLAGDSS